MAVIQISKIQIRRGLKNSNSGVPQLSSAELAWAVDTQELYIGNGSVAEGAPYVGNTKVLTEHDNILELASSYQFASDDPSITESVSRSLQSKIDEIEVSVADFGAVNDGSTDCVAAFEKAFVDLFRNSNPNFKKVLKVPNGDYLIASNLQIPSDVILRGETKHGVRLVIDTNTITFVTSAGGSLNTFNSSNRPRNVEISNLTIQRSSGQMVLSGLADSLFDNVIFQGEYNLGNPVASYSSEPAALFWENSNVGTRTTNLKFHDCKFLANSLSVKCVQTAQFETKVSFSDCEFFENDTGVYIFGVAGQSNAWKISDCSFEEIAASAFVSSNGYNTKIESCQFQNVGNGTGNSSNPSSPMISFGESQNNLVLNCSSDRQQNAGIVADESIDSIPEVFNSSLASFSDRNRETIFLSDSFRPLAVISAQNKFTIINYVLKLGQENFRYTRVGQLTISLGDDLAGDEEVTPISLTDSYQFSPNFLTSQGALLMTNFEFSAELTDNDADSGIETIVIYYKNPLASGSTGTISFDVSYGV